jgi:hypothetical protein
MWLRQAAWFDSLTPVFLVKLFSESWLSLWIQKVPPEGYSIIFSFLASWKLTGLVLCNSWGHWGLQTQCLAEGNKEMRLSQAAHSPSNTPKTGVLDPSSVWTWNSTCQFLSLTPVCQRGLVKAEKGDLLHSSGHAVERGTAGFHISTQFIFSQLWGTDMSYRCKKTKI